MVTDCIHLDCLDVLLFSSGLVSVECPEVVEVVVGLYHEYVSTSIGILSALVSSSRVSLYFWVVHQNVK